MISTTPTFTKSATRLEFTTLDMPAALPGPVNPFPQLLPSVKNDSPLKIHPNVPEELRTHIGYGVGSSPGDPCLPYSLQDNYTRERRPETFRVAILENEHLRATILLDQGGRLWSLLHKATGRELVEVNPVFQPANLAIRNAWFSGGIEWNYGVRGHTPLGCDSLFAAELMHPEGWPVLRLWEFERIRAVPFQIDFLLPPDSDFLHVRVGLFNPHAETIPFYWWSNIAVPEAPDVRVLAPASSALRSAYTGGLELVDIPEAQGSDLTYSVRSQNSSDIFFNIPNTSRPWVAALDGDGFGLVQTSTSAQRGRKLFVWGNSQGGRQWQRFLTEGDRPYIEIQAGVARTQYESFPFPGLSRLGWIESYGLMQCDPKAVHGYDWKNAVSCVEARLEAALPAGEMETFLHSTDTLFDKKPDRIIQHGSGWGALECRRREMAEQSTISMPGSPFPNDSLGPLQEPWLHLLEYGTFPEQAVPDSWMVQPEWVDLLEKSADEGWLASLHRGVMRYHRGDVAGAKSAWERSLEKKRNIWALRNLAQLARFEGQLDTAVPLLLRAREIAPEVETLAVECVECLLEAGLSGQAMEIFQQMPHRLVQQGRLRALHAKAALADGHLDLAESLLGPDLVVANLREGEQSLHLLWWDLQEQREAGGGAVTEDIRRRVREQPIPSHLDFRQSS